MPGRSITYLERCIRRIRPALRVSIEQLFEGFKRSQSADGRISLDSCRAILDINLVRLVSAEEGLWVQAHLRRATLLNDDDFFESLNQLVIRLEAGMPVVEFPGYKVCIVYLFECLPNGRFQDVILVATLVVTD